MKKRIILILSAVILVSTSAAIVGVKSHKDYSGKQNFIRNEEAENSINSFDSKLFTTLCNQTENVNYSALSIYNLLYALSKGSDKNTEKEINSALHEVVVKVDEEKTKAAAVTMFGGKSAGGVSPDRDYIIFKADHPFCYVIYDEFNNIHLFTGIIRRPR
ncbi:MAG: hypothetical protein J6S91_09280 [Treponema sp.]|nr:hypothetical protein [Treponema sp.]